MEMLPCCCVLIPLILLGTWLAFAPLFRRKPKSPNNPPSP